MCIKKTVYRVLGCGLVAGAVTAFLVGSKVFSGACDGMARFNSGDCPIKGPTPSMAAGIWDYAGLSWLQIPMRWPSQ